MSELSGFRALLQIPIRLPDLVYPKKRKQRLAGLLRHLPDSLSRYSAAKKPSMSLAQDISVQPQFPGGLSFHFHISG
jgi:hypothetical protein